MSGPVLAISRESGKMKAGQGQTDLRKLLIYNFVSLNGFSSGYRGDISWNRHGPEENEYAAEGLSGGSILLFGRITYEMMAGFWPTPIAHARDPIVAEGMNNAEKIVFSKTMRRAAWNNTRVVGNDITGYIATLKKSAGKDLTILGSGSIITQCADAGLIDEFQIMINPVLLGKGTTIFSNLKRQLNLEHKSTRTFKSGTVLLTYVPPKSESHS